jgi:hypothetical protein
MKRNTVGRLMRRWSWIIAGVFVILVSLPMALANESNQAPLQEVATQAAEVTNSTASLRVEPPVVVFTNKRTKKGVWFIGSGLEPGQDVMLVVPGDGFTFNLTWGQLNATPVASGGGAFAVNMEIRPRQAAFLWEEMNTIAMVDPDTREVLATAPLIFCFEQTEEQIAAEEKPERLCKIAADLLPRK